MKKIYTHLWYDKEAKEAAEFYTSLFPDSEIYNVRTLTNTPSGDCDVVSFKLAGVDFMSISAGPIFKFNPSISLFATFSSEKEIDDVWDKLVEGGKVLMEYNKYPWATKYGWLEDKYGLSWQLSFSENHNMNQRITPALMFTEDLAGKTKEAVEYYTSIFPNSNIEMMLNYGEGEGDKKENIKHSRFSLEGFEFIAMDSSYPHGFKFNEAISFVVNCKDQAEIDYYWEKLSAVPEAEQCGWCKDKFGVSWQVVPSVLDEMMATGDQDKLNRLTQAFLKMKKFDIEELKKA